MKVVNIVIAFLNSFGSILSVFAALIFVLFFLSYQRTGIDFFDYSPFPITMKSSDTTNALKITLAGGELIESNSLTMRSDMNVKSKNLKYNLINLFSWCVIACYAIFASKVLKLLFVDMRNGGDNVRRLCAKRLKTLALMTFGLFTYNLLLVVFLKFYFVHGISVGMIQYYVSLKGINYTVLVLAHVLLFTGYFLRSYETIERVETDNTNDNY